MEQAEGPVVQLVQGLQDWEGVDLISTNLILSL